MRRLLALSMLVAAGCSSPSPYGPGAYSAQQLRQETFTVNSPAVVLGTPTSPHRVEDPWWLARNDPRLNVRRHPRTGEVVEYVVHHEDEQRSFGTRIRDNHRREVYSTRFGRIVR